MILSAPFWEILLTLKDFLNNIFIWLDFTLKFEILFLSHIFKIMEFFIFLIVRTGVEIEDDDCAWKRSLNSTSTVDGS